MTRLITYSDANMTKSADLCVRSALKNGFDSAWKATIPDVWVDANKEVLSQPRGAGYWLWKPKIIDIAASEMSEGDVLVYSDAGVEWINPVHYLLREMDQELLLFSNGWPHAEWCKAKVWKAITGSANYGPQVQASVIIITVCDFSKAFIKEWLYWCEQPGFIDDSPCEGNAPTFAEHRHDQAILTELAYKYEIRQHWYPSRYAEHLRLPGDNYPITLNHHRKRNNEW